LSVLHALLGPVATTRGQTVYQLLNPIEGQIIPVDHHFFPRSEQWPNPTRPRANVCQFGVLNLETLEATMSGIVGIDAGGIAAAEMLCPDAIFGHVNRGVVRCDWMITEGNVTTWVATEERDVGLVR
jgi:hypothetical protein